jgi:hypothetical protein
MTRRLLIALAALAAVAVGAAALVAGGKDGGSGVGPAAIAEAAERTARVEGVRYTMTGEIDVPRAGTVPFGGDGVTDMRGQRGTARMDMSAMADVVRKSGERGPAADPGNWQMDMVFDERFFYVKFPLAESELGGKSWFKIDVLASSRALGIDPVIARASQQQGDPAATLRYLRTVSDDVEKVGREDVRGVATTHYRATIDFRRYPDLVPEERREAARRSVARLVELNGGRETVDVEVWVGDDRLVRRMKWEQAMRMPGQSQTIEGSYSTDFYDFGTRVRIDPPPADETKDVTDETVAQLRAARGP